MPILHDETYRATLDAAVSNAILRRVAAGELGETLRVYRPKPVVAFGKRDVLSAAFTTAVNAARTRGFDAVIRLAGGRAAVFHPGTVAFAWTVPSEDPRFEIEERFERVAGRLAEALRNLGADARIGEVEGEYCPGDYSINVGGLVKVVGIGQRLVSGAAHVGGVLVVSGGEAIAEVLTPVYKALQIPFRPSTSGDLESAVGRIEWETARDVLLSSFARTGRLEHAPVDARTIELATELEPQHDPELIRNRRVTRRD